MSAPYLSSLSDTGYVGLALVLGFVFGFFLERAGFSSARKLTAQFYFKDFAVLKVMFTAIIVAMLGIAWFALVGWLDLRLLYIPPTFIGPQIVGGLLLGAGFIVGGYCPGTSIAAAAIGKLDALFFIAGVLLGTFAFGAALPGFKGFVESGFRGNLTLFQWLNLNAGIAALAVVAMAIAAFWVAEQCEGPWRVFVRSYGRSSAREEGQ